PRPGPPDAPSPSSAPRWGGTIVVLSGCPGPATPPAPIPRPTSAVGRPPGTRDPAAPPGRTPPAPPKTPRPTAAGRTGRAPPATAGRGVHSSSRVLATTLTRS